MSPATLGRLDAEHDEMAAALADASVAMAGPRRTPSEAQIAATRGAVTHLQAVTLAHLDHEESEAPDELATVRATVPAPVLAVVSGIFGRDYRRRIGSLWSGLELT